jgi:hypothetical protein
MITVPALIAIEPGAKDKAMLMASAARTAEPIEPAGFLQGGLTLPWVNPHFLLAHDRQWSYQEDCALAFPMPSGNLLLHASTSQPSPLLASPSTFEARPSTLPERLRADLTLLARPRHAHWDPMGLLAVRNLLRERLGALGELEEHAFQRGPPAE